MIAFGNILGKLARLITGDKEELALENRLFNAICFLALAISAYNIPFNYFTGLKATSLIFLLAFLVLSVFYYYARIKQQYRAGIILASALSLVALTANYFYDGGANGGSLLSFTLAFFLIAIISRDRLYWFWIVLALLLVPSLLLTEYYFPQYVSMNEREPSAYLVDLASTYLASVILIFIGLFFLKSAYSREKQKADERLDTLERMNNEKSRLFAVLSHDLNAPLATLQGYLQLLKTHRLPEEKLIQVRNEISDAVTATRELLADILSWSKNSINPQGAVLTPQSVDTMLAPVLRLSRLMAIQKDVQFVADTDASLIVQADMRMFQFIVRNLVSNAIKFTPASGTVKLFAKAEGNTCLVSVSDTGPGIPVAIRETIFSPGVTLSPGSAGEKGTGLGLFLSREYARAHHGDIRFETIPDQGTVFFLSLPLVATVMPIGR